MSMRLSSTATLKTFRQIFRNGMSPASVNIYNFRIRGFAGAGNFESESALIVARCKEKKVREAFGLWKAMTDKGVEPNLVSLNAVIQGLCEEERMEEAEEVVEEMNRKGLTPDENTYMSLFQLLCDRCEADKAYKVLSEMIVRGLSPSVVIYNKLVSAYCVGKRERVEKAVGILRVMAKRGLSPDAVSYTTVISGFCYLDEPELDKALEMKAEMLHKGILPDAVTYELLIQTLCLEGSLSKAFDLFLEMLRGGVSPDKLTYFILMNAYCLEGKFCKAFHMHHEMTHKGFLPDFVSGFSPSLVTYNALIHGLCLLGRVEEALGILRGMAAMGLPPDDVCYTTIISGLCKIGEPRKAYELKLEMDGKNFWWLDLDTYDSLMEDLSDEDIYSNMMNDYFAEGNMKKVYRLDYDMKHDGYLTSDVIFRVYLNALNKKARTIDDKRTLLDMIYKNLWTKPSYFTYDTLIENCSNNEFKSLVGLVKDFSMRGLVGDAGRARDTMLHGNYKPEGSVYNLLIFDHCRSYNVNKAYDMYKEMVHYGFAPHMFSILAVIKALHYDRRYNEMMWVIKNTLKSCNLNDSELRKVLNKINVRECDIDALLDVLAEIAMGGLLLDGGKCSYASAST